MSDKINIRVDRYVGTTMIRKEHSCKIENPGSHRSVDETMQHYDNIIAVLKAIQVAAITFGICLLLMK